MNILNRTWQWIRRVVFEFSARTIAAALVLTGLVWLKTIKDHVTLKYFLDHPQELISPTVVATLIMTVAALLGVVLNQKRRLSRYGVAKFTGHDSPRDKRRALLQLTEDVEGASRIGSRLLLLGETGKDTFSTHASPLFEILKTYKGAIKILLIQPESVGFKDRCDSMIIAPSAYLGEILDSLDFCKHLLVDLGRSVEVRLYTSTPIWKMIVTEQILWLQHYRKDTRTDDMPVHCFEFRDDGAEIFEGLKAVFRKRWQLDPYKVVDLKTYRRESWRDHCLGVTVAS